MDDGGNETEKRLREELEKPSILLFLVRLAAKITKDPTSAADLVSETIVRVLEEERPSWNGQHSFRTFMASKLRRVLHEIRRRRSSTEVLQDGRTIADLEQSPEPGPDDALERARTLREWDELLGRLNSVLVKEDLKIAQCLELMSEGRTVVEQATLLGWRVDQVYGAHRTIQRRGLEVRQAWDEEREAMMHARREAIPPSEESRP
jgi:RNA polymerase sigma factor (sigma-70 family)